MPRALFVTRRLGCGGVERSLVTLVKHLEHPDWDFVLAPLEAGGELAGEARHLYAEPSRPWPGPLRHAGYALRLTYLAWKLRPRVLVTFCLDSLIATCFVPRPPGTDWIACVGSDVHFHLETEYRPWHRLLQGLLGLAYRRPPRLVTVSQGLGRALSGHFGIPPERLSCIPNPLDLKEIQAGAEIDQPGGDFLLGVGRLIPVKGFDLLLRAAADIPEVRVVILGEGRERGRLQALARELGMAHRLEMPGVLANPWSWMRSALAVVVPSRSEGFSNVVAEALACQAALVVTDCPHGPRELVVDGVHARVVPSENVEALRGAIREVMADGNRYRQAGPERAREFAASRVCQAWLELMAA